MHAHARTHTLTHKHTRAVSSGCCASCSWLSPTHPQGALGVSVGRGAKRKKDHVHTPPAQVPFSRIAALNKPELPALAGGLVGSAAVGLMMPAFSFAFSSLVNTFYTPGALGALAGSLAWSNHTAFRHQASTAVSPLGGAGQLSWGACAHMWGCSLKLAVL